MHGKEQHEQFRLRSVVPLAASVCALLLSACSDGLTDPRFTPGGGPSTINSFTLDPIEVTACQYGGFYPDCKSPAPSGGSVMPSSPSSPSQPSSGGGSWGSSTPIPPDTTKRPPCNFTGDSIIDNPKVQAGLRQAWIDSNPAATNQADRREQGGWIVSTPGYPYPTLSFVPFTNVTTTPCKITPDGEFYDLPGGTIIAAVHTHPYSYGEVADACRYRDPLTGFMVSPIYRDQPSGQDYRALAETNRRLAAQGRPAIHNYVVDQDGIRRYDALPGQTATYAAPIPRCGY